MDNDEKKQVKEREVLNEHQPYLPNIGSVLNFSEHAEETNKQAGRFKSPRSQADRLLANVRQKIAELAGFNDLYSFRNSDYPVPPEWQEIFNYLYEEGIISAPQVYFESFFHDEPKIYSLRLWATSPEGKTDGGVRLMGGGYSRGISRNLEEAISKVIGELLERYPLALYRDRELVRASVQDLEHASAHFLNPFFVAQFSEVQKQKFLNRQFDKKSIFRWVKGRSLMRETEALIPAQLMFWNYRFEAGEPLLQQPITNGAAGHFTKDEVILAGLYELIQRDAFLVHWFNKITPPRIDPASVKTPAFQEIFRNLTRYNIRPEILDTTSDIGIPSFVCVLLDESGKGPAIALGGGCDTDAESAIIRAVTEAIGVSHWLRMQEEHFMLPEPYEPFAHPIGQEERLRLWGNPKMRSRFDFFLSGPRVTLGKRSPDSALPKMTKAEELLHVREILQKKGEEYEAFYYEANHPILRELGYHSVAVAVPALLPIYLNETMAPLGAARLRKAPEKMGYRPADEPNPWPHPFP